MPVPAMVCPIWIVPLDTLATVSVVLEIVPVIVAELALSPAWRKTHAGAAVSLEMPVSSKI